MDAHYKLLKDAREELTERLISLATENEEDFDDINPEDLNDAIHEVADSHVPVYTRDILEVCMGNLNLATVEPELGPAFDGTNTPLNLMGANIYEYIVQDLNDMYSRGLLIEVKKEGVK